MRDRPARSPAYLLLASSPVLMLAVWSTRFLAPPLPRYLAAGTLIAALQIATWTAAGRTLANGFGERRGLTVAGALLASVWASFALIGVLGPPDQATVRENSVRYVLLFIDAAAVAAALMILRAVLHDAGERFYSVIGGAAIALGGPMYLIFTIIQQLEYRAMLRLGVTVMPQEALWLDTMSTALLYAGAFLTYIAAISFAAALQRTGWLSTGALRLSVGVSILALVSASARIAEALLTSDGPIWGFKHWWSAPGFVFLIPAVPWIIPSLLGIGLLRRAADPTEIAAG